MKAVEVQTQVRLSLAKCFELVLSGVKYRLFRAAITVTIIALAAAFLTTMLAESVIARRVASAIAHQTQPREDFLLLTSRLSLPMSEMELTRDLGSRDREAMQAARRAEFATWGNLSDEQMDEIVHVARRQVDYQGFFDRLDEAQRRTLLEADRGMAVFRRLLDGQNFAAFDRGLTELGIRGQFPGEDMNEFRSFLQDWNATAPLRQKVLEGHAAVVEELRTEVLGGRDARQLLADQQPGLLEKLGRYGFVLTPEELASAADQAALTLDLEDLMQVFSHPTIRRRLSRELSRPLAQLNEDLYLRHISRGAGSKWLVDSVNEVHQAYQAGDERVDASLDIPDERVREVAGWRMATDRVASVEAVVRETAGDGKGMFGFSDRALWLLGVSFLVCIVGIANAMLMSVTERFREIATMKCLGATDGFIMVNFILESCMQGITGGVIGGILGLLLGTLRSWWNYGLMALQYMPWADVLYGTGVAIVLGVIVSAMAAVYPAWVAARLAPMEAMRIE